MAHQWPLTSPPPPAAAAPLLFPLRLTARWNVLVLRRPLGSPARRGRPLGRVILLPPPLLRYPHHDPGQEAVEPRDPLGSAVATGFTASPPIHGPRATLPQLDDSSPGRHGRYSSPPLLPCSRVGGGGSPDARSRQIVSVSCGALYIMN